MAPQLRCTICRGAMEIESTDPIVRCANGHEFGRYNGAVNFLGELKPDTHIVELNHDREARGIAKRTVNYLLPWMNDKFGGDIGRLVVLEDGAGGGSQVEEYLSHGLNAWGIDPGFRSDQWVKLERAPGRLFIADGCDLPFADDSFDVVTSSGVLEHVGEPRSVPERSPYQGRYLREILRVLRPGGAALVAHPNGAHPFDFWHASQSRVPGIRVHRPYEHYMPDVHQLKRWAATSTHRHDLRFLTPENYLAFDKVRTHRHGRALSGTMQGLFRGMTRAPRLASTWVNPWLVTEITKRG